MNGPSLNLPPLPAYRPAPHASALFAIRTETEFSLADMATDPEVRQADVSNYARSMKVLKAHQGWLLKGGMRFAPWHLLRLAVSLATA